MLFLLLRKTPLKFSDSSKEDASLGLTLLWNLGVVGKVPHYKGTHPLESLIKRSSSPFTIVSFSHLQLSRDSKQHLLL